MNYIGAAIGVGVAAYYLYTGSGTKSVPDGSGTKSVPDTSDIAKAEIAWSQNPKVAWYRDYFPPSYIKDPTRTPPMSVRQSIANTAGDPTLTRRPSGHGSGSDDTGTRQEEVTSKSIEQERSPVLQAVVGAEEAEGSSSYLADDIRRGVYGY